VPGEYNKLEELFGPLANRNRIGGGDSGGGIASTVKKSRGSCFGAGSLFKPNLKRSKKSMRKACKRVRRSKLGKRAVQGDVHSVDVTT